MNKLDKLIGKKVVSRSAEVTTEITIRSVEMIHHQAAVIVNGNSFVMSLHLACRLADDDRQEIPYEEAVTSLGASK
jgi:hypothetical protein